MTTSSPVFSRIFLHASWIPFNCNTLSYQQYKSVCKYIMTLGNYGHWALSPLAKRSKHAANISRYFHLLPGVEQIAGLYLRSPIRHLRCDAQLILYCLVVNTCTVKWLDTAVAQWLRCCGTNRKVAGSIPGGFFGIFHWHNPSDRTMALGSTQPLSEMSTRSISWG